MDTPPNDKVFKFDERQLNIIEHLLGDLTIWFDTDRKLFHELFCNREADYQRLTTLIASVESGFRNKDFLVRGEAGVGKTSFIYNLASDDDFLKSHRLMLILIDYRKALPMNLEGCLTRFIEDAEAVFQEQGHPIHTLIENIQQNIGKNMQAINAHIASLEDSSNIRRVIIVLDDFDYAEDTWFSLLDYFIPLVANPRATIILTARPQLYADIQGYDERFAFYFTRNVNIIDLPNLEVREILTARLAPVLNPKGTSITGFIINEFKKKRSFDRLLRKAGIQRTDGLIQFDYPLTEEYNIFMNRITNGNLREIFDIAYESIHYILKNYDVLKKSIGNGIERRIIGREGTLKILYDNEDACYKIINLNKHRSKNDNSLLFNVLEGVKRFNTLDDKKFYPSLQRLGHTTKEIRWAIGFLSNRLHRFIEPITLLPKKRRAALYLYDEYKVTQKGDFYLGMANWDEYESRCGQYGRSLLE
jgi:hypothetical protein